MGQLHFGIVEERNDPLRLGRCQVRVVDMMTHDKTVLPTKDLPWASVLQPVGSGNTVAPPNGTQVMVMYVDEPYCQMPVVIGQVPSVPQGETVFIDQYPDTPKVVDINVGNNPISLPANDVERANRANPEIIPTDNPTETHTVQGSNGAVNTNESPKASYRGATSGIESSSTSRKVVTVDLLNEDNSFNKTLVQKFDDVTDYLKNSVNNLSGFNILGMVGSDKPSIMSLATDSGTFKSNNNLNSQAQKITSTFGRANPSSTQKIIEKGNEEGSWLKSLEDSFNETMSALSPSVKSILGSGSDIVGVCGDVSGLIGECCSNLNGLGFSTSNIDQVLSNAKSITSTGSDWINSGIKGLEKYNNRTTNLSPNNKEAVTQNFQKLNDYTSLSGSFENFVLEGANLEQTLSTVNQNFYLNNFGDALNNVKGNFNTSLSNLTNFDVITNQYGSYLKNAPSYASASLTGIINNIKSSGISFASAKKIMDTLKVGGGKSVNLQVGFSSSVLVDPLTRQLRALLASGVAPLVIVQRTVEEVDRYARAIESTLTTIATSKYIAKLVEKGVPSPVMTALDGVKTANTCASCVRGITAQLKNVIIGTINMVVAGGEGVLDYIQKLVNKVLSAVFGVLNLGLGFVSIFLNMVPFGNIIGNFLLNLVTSFIPGVGTQYYDMGLSPSTVKDLISSGEFNINNFSDMGNLANVAKVGIDNVTPAMFAQVGEGNTPPINGEWGGVNFGGSEQPLQPNLEIDTSNTPSATTRPINGSLPLIDGVRISDENKARSNLTDVICNLKLPNAETKSAFLALAYAYCQFLPRVADYDYDTVGLISKFPKTFANASPEILEKYSNAQSFKKMTAEEFYNFVYSSSGQGQSLGNVAKDDGYKYADYGLIPLVGKNEYSQFDKEAGEKGWKAFENNLPLLTKVCAQKFSNLIQDIPFGNHDAVLQKVISVYTGIVDTNVLTKAYEHFYGASTFESVRSTEKTPAQDAPNSYYGSLTNSPDPDLGFQDPNGKYPYARERNNSSLDKLTRGESTNTIVTLKDSKRTFGIKTADGKTWNQPPSGFGAQYPYNHVTTTESGHIQEFDDTPNAERIHTYHRSGTFEEITANGNKIIKIVGDGYTLYDRNGFISIAGNANVTTSGNINIMCESDANIKVIGSTTLKTHGDLNLSAGNNVNICAGDSVRVWGAKGASFQSQGNINIKSTEGDLNLGSKGNMNLVGDSDVFLTGGENVYVHAKENCNIEGDENASLTSDGDTYVSADSNLNLFGALTTRLYGGLYMDVTSDADLRLSSALNLNVSAGLSALLFSRTFEQKTTTYHHVSAGNYEVSSLAVASLSAGGALNLSALGHAQLSALGTLSLESKGVASLTSVGSVGINGTTIMLNSGVEVPNIPYINTPVPVASDAEIAMRGMDAPVGIKPLSYGMVPISKGTPKYPNLEPLDCSAPSARGEQTIETPEQGNSMSGNMILAFDNTTNGYSISDNITENNASEFCPPETDTIISEKGERESIPQQYQMNCSSGNLYAGLPLSKHFILDNFFDGGFNNRHKLHDQCGLTARQIVTNLSFLANNVLEQILDLLPNGIMGFKKLWNITSGYRDAGHNARGSSNKSQHLRGQAIDIQVGGYTNAQSLQLARNISKKIDFDQMILEYSSKTGKCWIHISMTSGAKQRNKKNTMCPRGGKCTYLADFLLLKRSGNSFFV